MKRSPLTLHATVALAACLVLAATSIASATTRHKPLNARSMASSYMRSSLASSADVSQTVVTSAHAGGCSYRSFAVSYSVDPTSVVNAACRRAQAVVNGQVRSLSMSQSAARSFMSAFRGYCNLFFGPTLQSSTPTTATPVPGYVCPSPWGTGSSVSTPTPSVPTTPVPGYSCPGPWSGTATSTPPVQGRGYAGGCW